jgi:hypothetical protein
MADEPCRRGETRRSDCHLRVRATTEQVASPKPPGYSTSELARAFLEQPRVPNLPPIRIPS